MDSCGAKSTKMAEPSMSKQQEDLKQKALLPTLLDKPQGKNSDKPCSLGVVRDSNGLKGADVVKAGLPPLYYSGPKDASGEKFGVVILSDVCGSNISNPKYIADYLAGNGFHAALPDQFHRKDPAAWSATETEMMMPDGKTPSEGFACLNTEEFGKFFGAIANPEFITRLIKEDLTATVKWLKEVKGCTKVGFVGFSYGGMIGEQVSLVGLSDVTVSISGVHMSGGNNEPAHQHFLAIKEAGKCPMFYIRAQGETCFTDEAEKGFRDAGAKVQSFGEGMDHDFVLRGDFSEGSKTKELADKAMKMTFEHLNAAFVPGFKVPELMS